MEHTLSKATNNVTLRKKKLCTYYISIHKPQYKSSNNLSEILFEIKPKENYINVL